ncbi:hypothetical protein K9N68_01515 [Kovacikia minuta CCNUW1]|uniref:hypothetical protein n=1 Tax=Kovacikia minuta TaxID=2931930 RepID=UPI001CCBC753|nr:hypothetical protein [Kovacikia minuta]UBF26709.1 hypothetical protein K9N68_01515 [Kovacikia minuta CCNUW1]
MNIDLFGDSAIAWTISLASIAVCPSISAVMAYRISMFYSRKPTEPEPHKRLIVPMQIDEAAVNEAVKNLVF